MPTKIHFVKGDITEMTVDAVGSPANTDLALEGGRCHSTQGRTAHPGGV